jgi:hypothetical protein
VDTLKDSIGQCKKTHELKSFRKSNRECRKQDNLGKNIKYTGKKLTLKETKGKQVK